MFPGEAEVRPRGQAARLVRVDEDGATFTSHIDGSRQRLTPETSMAVQEALGADVILAFDERPRRFTTTVHARSNGTHPSLGQGACLEARTRDDQALYGISRAEPFSDLRTESARHIGSLPFEGAWRLVARSASPSRTFLCPWIGPCRMCRNSGHGTCSRYRRAGGPVRLCRAWGGSIRLRRADSARATWPGVTRGRGGYRSRLLSYARILRQSKMGAAATRARPASRRLPAPSIRGQRADSAIRSLLSTNLWFMNG